MTNFFEAGKTYEVCLKSTGATRKFKCTSADKNTLIVRGSYENGKEKAYKAQPAWGRLMDKQEGKEPDSYNIKINNRNGFYCNSSDQVKEEQRTTTWHLTAGQTNWDAEV